MDIGRIDFCAAERLQRSRIDLDICPPDSVEDRTRVVRGVDLRSIAMCRTHTDKVEIWMVCCDENGKDVLWFELAMFCLL